MSAAAAFQVSDLYGLAQQAQQQRAVLNSSGAGKWDPHLHAAVVNDHGVKFDLGVQFCHFFTALQEEPIA